ncbi:hypothetical protein ACQPZJ_14975 [Actinoplanes sp. CA-054009]
MNSPDENFIGSFVAYFDHGLLMVEDSESSATHEGWDAANEYVHFDAGSLYVSVQSLVDGAVEVFAYRDVAPNEVSEGLVEAFSGEVELELGRLKIHDSDDSIVLTATGALGRNQLTVLVDELNLAERVVLILSVPE